MKLALGTAGLNSQFEKTYWETFVKAIELELFLHSAYKYNYTNLYFKKAFEEKIKINKTIIKIEINKNPIKKLINIPKQVDLILNKFYLDYIDTVQICNNPSSNMINIFLLKSIFNKLLKKGFIKRIVLESFEPFSENLNTLIKDDFFEGYIFKLNCIQRGASKKFFKNILQSNKKIISISPIAGGKFVEYLNYFDRSLKESIDEIIKKNNIKDYNSLNLSFLKSIKNVETLIFGTKNKNRLIEICQLFKDVKPLSSEDVNRIIDLQEKYKFKINY